MMNVRPLDTAAGLPELIATQPLEPFLQSWAWGDFQAGLGRRIWRLGAMAEERLVGAALVIEHQLMMGKTYLYCPRGPVATSRDALDALLTAIRELGTKENAMYVKIDPGLYPFPFDRADFPADFSVGTTLQPRVTQVLDLLSNPDDVLNAMHPKTRYNIRLAEKKGVTVRWSTEASDLAHFFQLISSTYSRQGIRLHPAGYYQAMWKYLRLADMTDLGIAEFSGRPLAANMVIWHGQTATYLHGGSSDTDKHVMAPHLVQWATMKRAIERGVKAYDFWGVAPNDDPTHKWAGVTRFKKGFGGRVVTFPPALNAILQPAWYQAYRLAKRMRGGVDV